MKLNFKSFGSIHAIFGILSMALLAQAAFAETRFSNEFWVSTGTNTANLGTLDNPYDGSTQEKFDSRMDSMPANSTIHLLAGTYMTLGTSYYTNHTNDGSGYLKTGQKLLGSGMDVTIIKIVPGTVSKGPGQTTVLSTPYNTLCTNIEICDLTCDCSGSSNTPETYWGVFLNGTQMAVRRVKLIHQSALGAGVDPEANGIMTTDSFNTITNGFISYDSVGNIIEECEVSQFVAGAKGYPSAIAINTGSGIIRNNRILLSGVGGNGILNGWAHDLLVEGNYVDGAYSGFYSDTGSTINAIIVHNTFKNCNGVILVSNKRQNITIAYNNFILSNLDNWGIMLDGAVTNVAIIGNTISVLSRGAGAFGALNLNDYVTGLVFANNKVDASLTNYLAGCTNVTMYNNYDLNGNFLTNLNQVASPNGVTRTTVTYSGTGTCTYNATYADKYIGIKGFSGFSTQEVDIVLPSAVGHSGKDFVVVDETGLVDGTTKIINIKPTPTSPDQINGVSSVGIITPFKSKTAISDGTNWFAR